MPIFSLFYLLLSCVGYSTFLLCSFVGCGGKKKDSKPKSTKAGPAKDAPKKKIDPDTKTDSNLMNPPPLHFDTTAKICDEDDKPPAEKEHKPDAAKPPVKLEQPKVDQNQKEKDEEQQKPAEPTKDGSEDDKGEDMSKYKTEETNMMNLKTMPPSYIPPTTPKGNSVRGNSKDAVEAPATTEPTQGQDQAATVIASIHPQPTQKDQSVAQPTPSKK